MIDRAYNWMILAIRLAARACIPALRAWVLKGVCSKIYMRGASGEHERQRSHLNVILAEPLSHDSRPSIYNNWRGRSCLFLRAKVGERRHN